MDTVVMKFGGAALQSPEHIQKVAHLIKEKVGRVVVVVSAMGGTTDHLVDLAHQVAPSPSRRELDMLISVGERISMSLLAMALEDLGIPAVSLTGSQSGVITCGKHSEAEIQEVRPARILHSLEKGKVVIVAGFQGVSKEKEITTLGRGGSDTSAVALGVALKATQVEFYKDVPGIYAVDPKVDPQAELYRSLTYEEALSFDPFVIHRPSILLASKNDLPLHVLSYNKEHWKDFPGTWIASPTFGHGLSHDGISGHQRRASGDGSPFLEGGKKKWGHPTSPR